MSCKNIKKRLASLLHSETKIKASHIPLQKVITGKEMKSNSTNKIESGIPKKKRKKALKEFKRNYSVNEIDSKLILSEKSKRKDDSSCENISFISDIEINNSSCDENWVHEIETYVIPSKSERDTNISSQKLQVDTVYHVSNNSANNILSKLEDSYNECYRESEDLILSNTTLECVELESKKSLHTSYDMKDGKILILKERNPVYLHGSFIISVLYGSLQIFGHNLNPSSDKIEIYSLRGFSYLYIQNIHQGEHCTSDFTMKNKLRKSGVSKSDILNILSEMETNYSVLICTSLHNATLPYIEKHLSQKLLPITEDNFPMTIKDDSKQTNQNILVCNSQWNEVVTMIDSTSKVMICGGKGVGKSTLLRYITNKVLRNFNEILIIDLDPGQSEFTIPGCISAVIVREPIFGPNFTHLHIPERCIFIENIDVALEPDKYVNSVIELLKQCESLWGIPTLINYMGYSHSYGLNIASSVITFVSPTILLQINSAQQSKNFMQNLTPDTVKQHLDMFGGSSTGNMFYETVVVDSMCDGLTSWQAQGRTIREMCILSYFSTMLDNSLVLTSKNIPLYKISLKDITLINYTSKHCTNKLAVFNANLVGLCTATHTENIYNCHGWGIVRGIDEEVLVLITPVSEDILEIVTHLAVGSVSLPPSMLMYEDTNVGLIPYVSMGCISSFNYMPKRSYLPRRNK